MGTAVGELFAGYVIEGVLGRGGMGTVYLAQHPRLPRKVALKLLHRDVSTDSELHARFLRESSVVAGLDHPGIVAVLDQGVEHGQPWLAMQYVHGTDASRPTPRIVTVDRAVRIVVQVATALDHAHSRGILHRDVKPANILLTAAEAGSPERAVLTDFGIARQLSANVPATVTGRFAATLDYASPEQLSGGDVDARSDQYSLACTLYTLLTGEPPYTAADSAQVIAGHLIKPVPGIDRPGVPAALARVVARALAKDPSERYSSAGEFAFAAEAALYGSEEVALPGADVAGALGTADPETVDEPGSSSAPAGAGRTTQPPLRPIVVAPEDNPWPAYLAMMLGISLIASTGAALPMILAYLQTDLHAGTGTVHRLNTLHDLGWAVPLIAAGWLGDRFGPKNIQILALGVFSLAALTCGLAGTIGVFSVAYAVLACASTLVLPQAMSLTMRIMPRERRVAALSVWTGTLTVAMMGGEYLDASVVTALSWRWFFLITVPLGLGAVVMTAVLVPELPRQGGRLDLPGLVFSGLALALFGLGIDQWSVSDWGAVSWELFMVPSLLLAVAFVLRQSRPQQDAMATVLLRDRDIALSMLAMAAMGAALSSSSVAVAVYLQLAQQLSLQQSTAIWLPSAAAAAVAIPLSWFLTRRLHPAVLAGIGFGVLFVSTVLEIVAMAGATPQVTLLAVASALTGVGSPCSWTPLALVVTRRVPVSYAGIGAGLFVMAGEAGIMAGRSASGAVLNWQLAVFGGPAAPTAQLLQHTARSTMVIPTAFIAFGLLPAVLVRRGRSAPAATTIASVTPVR